jgi:hypothetical protein
MKIDVNECEQILCDSVTLKRHVGRAAIAFDLAQGPRAMRAV